MKTKTEAAKALTAMGWSRAEIQSVLGDVPELEGRLNKHHTQSPWWSCIDDDWYAVGTPMVEEWEVWLEDKS